MLDAPHVGTKRTRDGEIVDVYRFKGGTLFYLPDVKAWREYREVLDRHRQLHRDRA